MIIKYVNIIGEHLMYGFLFPKVGFHQISFKHYSPVWNLLLKIKRGCSPLKDSLFLIQPKTN